MDTIKKRTLEGRVVSTKMDKTIVVSVGRFRGHPLYKKNFRVHTKYKAHDSKQAAAPGDIVRIIESRPFSKQKKFKLLEVVRKAGS